VAQLPLPGRPLEAQLSDADRLVLGDLPQPVVDLLARLDQHGHTAVLVGGCLRDLLRGVPPNDWDVATSAPPEAVAALFPGASWENRFGTVTVLEPIRIEVTTFRMEGGYRDRRRPDEVRWGSSIQEDLARRDFTMNAVAWRPVDLDARAGTLVDPFGGAEDLRAGLLRAVGRPERRFEEDALRLLRAVRFAACLDLRIDPSTEAAIQLLAPTVASVSGERVRNELLRILACRDAPSVAFVLMERLGLLPVLLGELAALRAIPQGKPLAGDALEHSLRTAAALPPSDPILRLAGLLHDLGKIATPDSILRKPGDLDADEEEVLRGHAELGYRLVEGLGVSPVDVWIRHHHEAWDGSGYPHGLAGDDIPLGSRIILVADAFDAMTTERAYRAGSSVEAAILELRRCCWTQFDARVVAALEQHLAEQPSPLAESA